MKTMQARNQSRPAAYDVADDDALYETRMPSSARRYKPSTPARPDTGEPSTQNRIFIQQRSSRHKATQISGIVSNAVTPRRTEQQEQRRFPLVSVLVGMVLAVVLIMSIMALTSWWRIYQDDLRYGRPRTMHIEAVVGHGDSRNNPTHFILLNLHRRVQIIEMPGGDPAHTRIFAGPVLFGDGQDLTPVTGEVRDVNGDHLPDLVVHIENQQMILLNDGKTFKTQ
jgi:hypothetical protein